MCTLHTCTVRDRPLRDLCHWTTALATQPRLRPPISEHEVRSEKLAAFLRFAANRGVNPLRVNAKGDASQRDSWRSTIGQVRKAYHFQ